MRCWTGNYVLLCNCRPRGRKSRDWWAAAWECAGRPDAYKTTGYSTPEVQGNSEQHDSLVYVLYPSQLLICKYYQNKKDLFNGVVKSCNTSRTML